MLFNSLVFVAFFAVVYAAYLGLQRWHRAQNGMLLAASWFFYGWWDWRFLGLLGLSTIVDFSIGRALDRTPDDVLHTRRRKRLLLASIATNLGILGFFKYVDFFAESLVAALAPLGIEPGAVTLGIVLPVGISFYTFQTMSYTIDVYRGRLQATDRLLEFALFVAFFPQLVAGPIERASHLLPQILEPREIRPEQVSSGIWLILWGFFKKLTVADNVGRIVEQVFSNGSPATDLDIVLGVMAFAVQIYCDFSGYSDIARGLSRLMGFEIMVNFRLPYFATTPSDFWQRWHISLSTWLRDYLYVPLGGNRHGSLCTHRNLCITMLLGGLWHGAAWNFVLWGAFHGAILVAYRPLEDPIRRLRGRGGVRRAMVNTALGLVMLSLTLYGWLLFRASSFDQILWLTTHASLETTSLSAEFLRDLVFFTTPLLLIELAQHLGRDLGIVQKAPVWIRGPIYLTMILWIFIFGARRSMEFIYFQF